MSGYCRSTGELYLCQCIARIISSCSTDATLIGEDFHDPGIEAQCDILYVGQWCMVTAIILTFFPQ